MRKNEKLNLIRETGIVAIMRANESSQLIDAAIAISNGGVKVIEVTMTTPGALNVIEKAKQHFNDDILFGAGSVLDAETARTAILAGADFIVAPTLNLEMIDTCNRYAIPVMPGCFTPSEALMAWESGADMIKLFPANIGGPAYIKAILAPLPQLEIIPVGGVNFTNAAEFIHSGAAALGIGSHLIDEKILKTNNFSALTTRAEELISIIQKARGKKH